MGVAGFTYATSGPCKAVLGQNDSTTGFGVFGDCSATTGINYGVWGQVASSSGIAIHANGDFEATGVKSFRIDHPFDPENMYLKHYCQEGPEPQNVYNGMVETDAQGRAWVRLPDYFEEINKDFRYQLTVIDDSEGPGFVQVKVARKIQGNRFLIMTSAPHIEVSWEIKAKRNDLWVQKHGAPVEVEKEGRERGRFQHPELYGKPKERGMSNRPEPRIARTHSMAGNRPRP
jgi:hypothetical protein